jgi:phosphoribosylanthranilate isomerase
MSTAGYFGINRQKEMRQIAVQIYEIQDPEEAHSVVSLGVNRVGSVIVSSDNWKVPGIKEAVVVTKEAGAKHSIIPLFHDMEKLCRVIDFYKPDILHFCDALVFHGSRTAPFEKLVEVQVGIKDRFPDLEIMRTIPIASADDDAHVPTLQIADVFQGVSDCFLTDTWSENEPVKGFIGITGRTCNWEKAKKLVESSTIPVIVAGGLAADNVYDAIRITRPYGVDSCTGTNIQNKKGNPVRFQKDLDKVKRFVEAVRRAERDFAKNGAKR